MFLRSLDAALEPFGLVCFGGFTCEHADWRDLGVPEEANGQPAQAVAIIGNVGSSLWPAFSKARERGALKRSTDPLNDWTKRVITPLCETFGGRAVFPFEGPPYWPFQRWALATGCFFPSPIGLLIHERYGLWQAFRAAFLFEHLPERQKNARYTQEPPPGSPCTRCEMKPCLNTCPVSAFSENHYDVERCRSYVRVGKNACLAQGCEARRACPIGREYRYQKPHARFHMRAFAPASHS